MRTRRWARRARGEFFASCDFEDLRLGDARAALEEYRRAVSAQGLGVPEPDEGAGARAWNPRLRGEIHARRAGIVADGRACPR